MYKSIKWFLMLVPAFVKIFFSTHFYVHCSWIIKYPLNSFNPFNQDQISCALICVQQKKNALCSVERSSLYFFMLHFPEKCAEHLSVNHSLCSYCCKSESLYWIAEFIQMALELKIQLLNKKLHLHKHSVYRMSSRCGNVLLPVINRTLVLGW